FFFSSRRRHTRSYGDWSSDVCSSDLGAHQGAPVVQKADVDDAGVALVNLLADLARGDVPQPDAALAAAARQGRPVRAEAETGRQIGRASCRERGQNGVEEGRETSKKG